MKFAEAVELEIKARGLIPKGGSSRMMRRMSGFSNSWLRGGKAVSMQRHSGKNVLMEGASKRGFRAEIAARYLASRQTGKKLGQGGGRAFVKDQMRHAEMVRAGRMKPETARNLNYEPSFGRKRRGIYR